MPDLLTNYEVHLRDVQGESHEVTVLAASPDEAEAWAAEACGLKEEEVIESFISW